MLGAFLQSYLFHLQFYAKVSNAAKFNIPLKKYSVSRTQDISSVMFVCLCFATLLAESLRSFIAKSGKCEASRVLLF